MSKRVHNIFFHLHTVSSIVISVGLFVIFFAGAFTLFYHPVLSWEQGAPVDEGDTNASVYKTDYNQVMDSLAAKGYDMYGRSMYTNEKHPGRFQTFYVYGSVDTLANEEAQHSFNFVLDKETYQIKEEKQQEGLGDLLYELHFFYQLGQYGYYLSGLVSLFFLFALVTGIVVHWKKIVSNFFVFRPKTQIKTVWTDAHTALGVIGIPFQFLYALTGSMFGLGIVIGLVGSIAHDGDMDKFYDVLYGEEYRQISLGDKVDVTTFDYNAYKEKAENRWTGFKTEYVSFRNLGSTSQQFSLSGSGQIKDNFLSSGEVVYNMYTGKVLHEHDPTHTEYNDAVWGAVFRLHYAEFGNIETLSHYLIKTLYFLMAILTSFVIISGVLIWLTARNKRNIPEKRRKYNEGIGHIYLAVCLTLLPITAISFIVTRLIPGSLLEHKESIINYVFFLGWLMLSLFFWRKKDNYLTNKFALLSTGYIGLTIPIFNGLSSGNWIWLTFTKDIQIFVVDLLWFLLSGLCLFIASKIKRRKPNDLNKISTISKLIEEEKYKSNSHLQRVQNKEPVLAIKPNQIN
ncbi:MAG: PepSY-associated TM helix domain-containing protein [Bacteroidota bacterium]